MLEHGSNYRPYDCSQCAKKFFFRAELDNHLIDHENGRIAAAIHDADDESSAPTRTNPSKFGAKIPMQRSESDGEREAIRPEALKSTADDDDEYIEVEQIGENIGADAMGDDDSDGDGNDKRPDRPKSYHEDGELVESAHA